MATALQRRETAFLAWLSPAGTRDDLAASVCPVLRCGGVGAMDFSTAPLTEPDMPARIRLFGSIDHSASKSWPDACEVLSSSQRVLSETSRPVNQDGG